MRVRLPTPVPYSDIYLVGMKIIFNPARKLFTWRKVMQTKSVLDKEILKMMDECAQNPRRECSSILEMLVEKNTAKDAEYVMTPAQIRDELVNFM